jgi:hypothetical protein
MLSDKTGMFTKAFLKHSVSITGCGSYWLNAGPFLSFHIHFLSVDDNQCPDEIVPDKLTSTTLRNPSLAHKHDSTGSLLLKTNQLNRVYM